MSATKDRDQKFTFVYSNFYKVYLEGKELLKAEAKAAHENQAPRIFKPLEETEFAPRTTAQIIKVADLKKDPAGLQAQASRRVGNAVKISDYRPMELIEKRLKSKEESQTVAKPTLKGLKDNLVQLNELNSRLRFLLQELKDLDPTKKDDKE